MNISESSPGSSRPRSSTHRQGLVGAVVRFPNRFRERRFWYVQLLVLVATSAHYFIESSGYVNPYETLHSLAISLYILPLIYAALYFGWEGTIFTALWAVILTSPSTWIWHHSGFHWFGEVGQVAVTLFVGILVAWRVDLEARQRRRAELTSAELALLNDIGGMLSYTLEVERELPRVLRRLAGGLGCSQAWLCLEPESDGTEPTVEVESTRPDVPFPERSAVELHGRLKASGEATVSDGRLHAARLLGEGRMLGSLGVAIAEEDSFGDEQRGLLTTVAGQLGVALENARHYRQRQENLQSYARQVTQAQEEERLWIARELHDDTAQGLVQSIRKLEELRRDANPGQLPAIDELLEITSQELRSVRRFARDLRPPVLDVLGLVAALETVIQETSERLPKGVRLEVVGPRRRIDASIELVLFRIAQEALRNVEKHARAQSSRVELRFTDDSVRLEVNDDGGGFVLPRNSSDLSRLGKLGILGMRERAELIGGKFQLESAPGEGSRLVVEVPAAGT